MNEHLRRAMEALDLGAQDVRRASFESSRQVRRRLRETVEEVLDHLEADQQMEAEEPEDVVGRLDRQSQQIAEDLRRIDRLMKQRLQRD